MLDNIITLNVDLLNSGVMTPIDFIRFDEYQNRTVYISENHEPGMRDLLTFYRTFPKQVGTFKGVRKSSAKFTTDFTVSTSDGLTTISPSIVEVNSSLPVGLSDAQLVKIRQRAIALLDQDILMNKLQGIQMV